MCFTVRLIVQNLWVQFYFPILRVTYECIANIYDTGFNKLYYAGDLFIFTALTVFTLFTLFQTTYTYIRLLFVELEGRVILATELIWP